MKKILLTTIFAAMVFITTGCEQFSTSYQRIDDTEFRLLDFIYLPADAAPGDTLTIMAVFAGKEKDLVNDIEWWISFNVSSNLYGTETVVDSLRLEKVAYRIADTTFSTKTQAVLFNVKIPDSIVRKSATIPEVWTDMLPSNRTSAIPEPFASMTKNQLIDSIEAFSKNYSQSLPIYLPFLLQFFTVPIRVTAKIKEDGKLPHTIRSSHSIRYNNRFVGLPINTNPSINSVVMYKVQKKDLQSFDNKDGLTYSTIRLDGVAEPVVSIEKGYSYFLDADTERSFDYTLTLDGSIAMERHVVSWQFQLDKEEASKVHHTEYMDIQSFTGKLTPPTDKNITKFTLWVTVSDEVINERLRPQGSILKEVSGRFEYK